MAVRIGGIVVNALVFIVALTLVITMVYAVRTPTPRAVIPTVTTAPPVTPSPLTTRILYDTFTETGSAPVDLTSTTTPHHVPEVGVWFFSQNNQTAITNTLLPIASPFGPLGTNGPLYAIRDPVNHAEPNFNLGNFGSHSVWSNIFPLSQTYNNLVLTAEITIPPSMASLVVQPGPQFHQFNMCLVDMASVELSPNLVTPTMNGFVATLNYYPVGAKAYDYYEVVLTYYNAGTGTPVIISGSGPQYAVTYAAQFTNDTGSSASPPTITGVPIRLTMTMALSGALTLTFEDGVNTIAPITSQSTFIPTPATIDTGFVCIYVPYVNGYTEGQTLQCNMIRCESISS